MPTRYDPDVLIHQNKVGYLAANTKDILDSLMEAYEIIDLGPPIYHLGGSSCKGRENSGQSSQYQEVQNK